MSNINYSRMKKQSFLRSRVCPVILTEVQFWFSLIAILIGTTFCYTLIILIILCAAQPFSEWMLSSMSVVLQHSTAVFQWVPNSAGRSTVFYTQLKRESSFLQEEIISWLRWEFGLGRACRRPDTWCPLTCCEAPGQLADRMKTITLISHSAQSKIQ